MSSTKAIPTALLPDSDNSPLIGTFESNAAGECTRVDRNWCRLSGLTQDESLGGGWFDSIHPHDRPAVLAEWKAADRERRPFTCEYRLLRPDATTVWVLVQATARRGTDGDLAYSGTVADVSSRRATEQALRESEERYRRLVEFAPDLIAELDSSGRFVYINDAGVRLLRGTHQSQFLRRDVFDFVHPDSVESARANFSDVMGTGGSVAPYETRLVGLNGATITVEAGGVATVLPSGPGVHMVARDLSDRLRAEDTQRATDAVYRAVVEGTTDAVWVMDRDTEGDYRASLVNGAFLRLSGLSREQLVGKTMLEVAATGAYDVETAELAEARMHEAIAASRPVEIETETRWNGHDVSLVTVHTPIFDETGRCIRVVGKTRNTTARKHAERALRESEANYRAVVEGTSDAVWVMDRDADGAFRVSIANARVEALLGVPAQMMIGRTLHEVLDTTAADAAVRRYAEAEVLGTTIEYETVITRTGRRVEVMTQITPLFDGEGHCHRIIGSARDVTGRRQAESALLQSQKLESLGVLAGGIAHDFNNLLTTILGNLYLAHAELDAESPLLPYLDDARLAGERGGELIRRLLAYSRPGLDRKDRISLDSLVRETASFAQRALSGGIELRVQADTEAAIVDGEFSALQQVLLNLIFNARDAMPAGGIITVSRETIASARESAWPAADMPPRCYHAIIVSDTGTGIAEGALERIFDPFFTTKEFGKGTGLGLSTAFSIARAHGGWIDVRSKVGEGSIFRVVLPEAASACPPPLANDASVDTAVPLP